MPISLRVRVRVKLVHGLRCSRVPLGSPEEFQARLAEVKAMFEGRDVPRPEEWVGSVWCLECSSFGMGPAFGCMSAGVTRRMLLAIGVSFCCIPDGDCQNGWQDVVVAAVCGGAVCVCVPCHGILGSGCCVRVLDQVKYAITWMLCDENAEFSCGRWDVMLQALYGEHWQY